MVDDVRWGMVCEVVAKVIFQKLGARLEAYLNVYIELRVKQYS